MIQHTVRTYPHNKVETQSNNILSLNTKEHGHVEVCSRLHTTLRIPLISLISEKTQLTQQQKVIYKQQNRLARIVVY